MTMSSQQTITKHADRVCRNFGFVAACCMTAFSQAAADAGSIPYSHGEPTNYEQYQLELVNAARANPSDEAARLGIDLNEGLTEGRISTDAKQPLAFHPLLLQTARGHSDWMLNTNTFSHTGSSGSTPTERAAGNGYDFGVAENIAYVSTSATLDLNASTFETHDNLFKSSGHRTNLMDPSYSVVGLGLRTGLFSSLNALMVTQNFSSGGDSADSGPFLLGVVYDDKNDNGVYDPGEGLEGVRVEPSYGGYHAITSASGGYAVPLPPNDSYNEDVPVPLAVETSTWEQVRPYDEAFRLEKISSATVMDLQVAFSVGNLQDSSQVQTAILKPTRINYKLKGTDGYYYQRTMVSSFNVKEDLKSMSQQYPSIGSHPDSTLITTGNTVTLRVKATGTGPLTYQWYQGVAGDTKTPVGANSSTFTTPTLTQSASYWVRVTNLLGSNDSLVAIVTVLDLPATNLNVGNQVASNFGVLISQGRILKMVGKLPTGLKFNAKTGALSGIITKAGTYSASIQVLSGKTLLTTIPLNFQVAAFPSTLAGSYEAIVRDAQGTPKGAFSLTIGMNVWSAALRESGQSSLSVKGSFVLDMGSPTATLPITFKGKAPISLKLDGNSPIINATIGDLVLEGFKLASTAENPTSPQAVAMVLDSGEADGVSLPAGFGWASGSISKLGKGSLVGMLADGTKLTAPISLSTTGQAVLWVQPYKNRSSYLAGVISVDGIGQPSNTDLAIAENCIWVLNPGEKGNPYGFSGGLNVGVRFGKIQQPTAGSSLSFDLSGAPKNSSGNDLDWPSLFTVDAKYNLIATGSSIAWKGKINTKNGSFSGTYTIPKGTTPEVIGTTASASGVFLQDAVSGQSIGYGLIKVPVAPTGTFRTAGIFIKSP
jgi:uncharacterized protein YkwD